MQHAQGGGISCHQQAGETRTWTLRAAKACTRAQEEGAVITGALSTTCQEQHGDISKPAAKCISGRPSQKSFKLKSGRIHDVAEIAMDQEEWNQMIDASL